MHGWLVGKVLRCVSIAISWQGREKGERKGVGRESVPF